MENKQTCLLILPRSVFPPLSGYAIKNSNLIQLLNAQYDLTLVVLKETDFTPEETAFYRQNSVHTYLWKRSKIKSYLGALRALFSSTPLQVGYYYDQKLQSLISGLLMNCNIAVAVLDRTVEYLKTAPAETIRVFDIVDSIALNYINSKSKTRSILWRFLYSIEGKRLLQYEQLQISLADITYFINKNECDYWSKAGKTQWLPHGVKDFLFDYNKTNHSYQNAVAFIGKMDYQPNIDAIKWYIEHVHSVVGERIPLIIVGAYPTKEIDVLAHKYTNISITGFVDDPYLILNSAMALIAPMQTGGGIQNKVLEGMALGKINVITSLAAKPIIGAENGREFLIADKAEDYISILKELSIHPDKYSEIGPAAKRHIQNNFTWKAYGKAYLNGIRQTSSNQNIEVLMSCMNQQDIGLVSSSKITTDVLIINQADDFQTFEDHPGNQCIRMITTPERGLSNSRNMGLKYCHAHIAVLCDDDVVYTPDYAAVITSAFRRHPEADIIAFQVEGIEQPFKSYCTAERQLNFLTAMKVSSVEIALNVKSVQAAGIRFDSQFGAGAKYNSSEECIFLSDCLRKKLKIWYVPQKIADLHIQESTWFTGYDEHFFICKGASFTRMSPLLSLPFIIQYVVRKHNLYKDKMRRIHALKYMLAGRRQYLAERKT